MLLRKLLSNVIFSKDGSIRLKIFAPVLEAVSKSEPWQVLMYHRIVEPEVLDEEIEPGMYVTPKAFQMQMEYISKNYNVISLSTLIENLEAKSILKKNTLVLTFDDGWVDNFTNAFEVLRKFDLPATIFLATDFIGQKDYLSWDMIYEMKNSKIDFGFHTASHLTLANRDRLEILQELEKNKQTFESQGLSWSKAFCYPKGFYDRNSQEVLKAFGFDYALKVGRESFSEESPSLIGRVGIHNDISNTLPMFRFRLNYK